MLLANFIENDYTRTSTVTYLKIIIRKCNILQNQNLYYLDDFFLLLISQSSNQTKSYSE